MTFTPLHIKDSFLIEPGLYKDHRGFFFESYNKADLEKVLGHVIHFVQDNHSVSKKGVLRGMHYQEGEKAQAKMVRVIRGAAIDIIVDLRKESPTYGEQYKVRLSAENFKILFIPRGVAHGFLALEDDTLFVYKCDNFYSPDAERGIIYNDPFLKLDWEYPEDRLIISEKDRQLPCFNPINL